jgi:hypothetical protein
MDRRELILARMFLNLQTVTPLPPATTLNIVRNRGGLPPELRPGIVMLDGVEDHLSYVEKRGRPALSPNKVRLRPQIFILLTPRDTVKNEGVGQELNAYRVKVVQAMDQDPTLMALIGANGEFVYVGGSTDMQTGSAMKGEFKLDFAVVYPFNPSEL